MSYIFFYISMVAIWMIFAAVYHLKPINISTIIIGIVSSIFSFVYEVILSEYLNLYHYINTGISTVYLVMACILLYPVLNVIFVLFLPEDTKKTAAYTAIWIFLMLIFEYLSVITGTVVFTGWKPIPWSIVTYILTYAWIIPLYRYLTRRIPAAV